MGPILTGIFRAILNRILKGFGFNDADAEVIYQFLLLMFKRIFKTGNGLALKQPALNYMSRMVKLSKRVSDEHLEHVFNQAEKTLVDHVDGRVLIKLGPPEQTKVEGKKKK